MLCSCSKFNISGLFSELINYSGYLLFTKSLRVQTESDQGLQRSFPKPVSLWHAKQVEQTKQSFNTLLTGRFWRFTAGIEED
ncbi:hypothetical protein DPMN_126986 [Dreissena polymorpha]|uniref:Uncharacterized protein n=1 Tax=Dreissena polymorpha TaxID=45954 RepID=A0A9D4GY44_DREPO|nr:hypothetical protein DPMN_126986 [Dreissena polymorpha]